MADKKISDFTAVTAVADADLLEIETAAGNSRKVTRANLFTFRGALVHKAGDETAANYTAVTAIAWDSEANGYDTDGFHDTVTNNSRLTVPSGVTKVRVSAGLEITALNLDEWVLLIIAKNGSSSYVGSPRTFHEVGTTVCGLSATSAVLNVIAGDYFQAFLQIEADTSVTLTGTRCWFAIEAVG